MRRPRAASPDPRGGDGRFFTAKDLVATTAKGPNVLVVDPATLEVDEGQTEAKCRQWQLARLRVVNGNTSSRRPGSRRGDSSCSATTRANATSTASS